MPEKLRMLVLPTEANPYFADEAHTLDRLQHLVGGSIEVFHLPERFPEHIVAICNEEGRIFDLPPNPFSFGLLGPPLANLGTPVQGTVLIVRESADGYEFESLTDEDMEMLKLIVNVR